jgi:predicted amidophosphoribosyltransferase
MSWQYMLLLPWAMILPVAVFMLFRRNYRANSGLCQSCGSPLDEGGVCPECGNVRSTSAFRALVIIAFILWVYASLAVLRGFAL